MIDHFLNVVADSSTWAYLTLALFSMLDAVLPVIPSETAVITAGVTASSGRLSIGVVVMCAAVGASVGDNLTYLIGATFGERARTRFFAAEPGARRLARAREQLSRRGGELILVGRFIPGGRTAVTLTAGSVGYPWPRFGRFDAAAAILWASYAALLGYLGGTAFRNEPWKGLLLAFGVALLVTVATELVRVIRRRRCKAAPQSRYACEALPAATHAGTDHD